MYEKGQKREGSSTEINYRSCPLNAFSLCCFYRMFTACSHGRRGRPPDETKLSCRRCEQAI